VARQPRPAAAPVAARLCLAAGFGVSLCVPGPGGILRRAAGQAPGMLPSLSSVKPPGAAHGRAAPGRNHCSGRGRTRGALQEAHVVRRRRAPACWGGARPAGGRAARAHGRCPRWNKHALCVGPWWFCRSAGNEIVILATACFSCDSARLLPARPHPVAQPRTAGTGATRRSVSPCVLVCVPRSPDFCACPGSAGPVIRGGRRAARSAERSGMPARPAHSCPLLAAAESAVRPCRLFTLCCRLL